MYVGRDFDPVNPTESEVFSMDFANLLETGELVTSVSAVNLTVFQGVDANPGSHLSGGASFLGSVVSQRLGGAGAPGGNLIAGVTYTVTYTVATNLTNTLTLYSRIACRPIQ